MEYSTRQLEVAKISDPTVFPKHGMLGRTSSDGLVANARNTHDLTIVIDRRGGSGSVARDQREVVDLIWRPQSPHGWAKLEDLGAATRGVMNAILRPADYLTQVVGSGCKAVISASKIGQSPHLAPFPNEPEIDIADVVRRTVESRATPVLAERLRIGSLGNTYDDALGIFNVPCDAAVWSAKCAQVRERTASPQRSVPIPIRQSGIASHPALVIDAVSPATRAAEIGEGRHLVLHSMLCREPFLCLRRRDNRPATGTDQDDE